MDQVMMLVSGRFTWIPLYILFAFILIRDYRSRSWLIILFAILAVVLSDQVSNMIKEEIMRLRPSHQPGVMNRLHYVNGSDGQPELGGLYGFVSNHAANATSLAIYLILVCRNKFVTWGLILWALLICYSRIYLGLHYPFDVLCGIILGIATGSFARWVCMLLHRGTSFTEY